VTTVKNIYDFLDEIAPFACQMDFDNAGFLVGRADRGVNKILVSLDITREVVDEAGRWGAELIVSHHPVIFHPVKSITDETVTGRVLLELLEKGIAAICAHTNLDAAENGVNDCLARAVGLEAVEQLHQDGVDAQGRPYGIGRVGMLPRACSAREFAALVQGALNAPGVRYADAGRPVRRVAVGGGACGSMLSDAAEKGCDTFLTADVKHDVYLEAKARRINLLDAGHFSTEDVVCLPLARRLGERFPQLTVEKSALHREVFHCL